ncbi:MAG: sortase [bacterium]
MTEAEFDAIGIEMKNLLVKKSLPFFVVSLYLFLIILMGFLGFTTYQNFNIKKGESEITQTAFVNTKNQEITLPEMISSKNLVVTGSQLEANASRIIPPVAPKVVPPVISGPRLTIDKIGLKNVTLAYSSVKTLSDVDKKLLYSPVVENQVTQELCSKSGNAYIYGHSEPAKRGTENLPGVNIFSDLTAVKAGDVINVTNLLGKSCSYKVFAWDKTVTDSDDRVSSEEFNRIFNPEYEFASLTIQTCQKGSTTVRLLLRAKLIA